MGQVYDLPIRALDRTSFSARRNRASKALGSVAERALVTAASAEERPAPKFISAEITSSSLASKACLGRSVGAGRQSGEIEFVAQLQHHAFGGLLSDAGNAYQLFDRTGANRRGQLGRGQTAERRHCQLGADAADRDEFLEHGFVGGGDETEQQQRVFADVGMDVQAQLAPFSGSDEYAETGMVTS